MAHIHTKPGQHDLTVSAYIVRLDLPEPAIVLHLHRTLKKWMQFGGHIELDENPWQALKRELAEESGYKLPELQILQPALPQVTYTNALLHPVPAATLSVQYGDLDHYHIDLAYAMTATTPPSGKIANQESDVLRTFTAYELRKLSDDEIPANVRELSITILEGVLPAWPPMPTDVWN